MANLFEENLEQLAAIESLDNGKAMSMAKVDVGMSAGCLRYYGGWADKIEGKVIDTIADTFNYTKQEPVCSSVLPALKPRILTIGLIGYLCRLASVVKSSRGTSLF